MDNKEYIASGILELYVAGVLSEEENQKVYDAMQKYPEILLEVRSIENAIIQITAATKKDGAYSFADIKNKIQTKETKVIPLQKPTTNWLSYVGHPF